MEWFLVLLAVVLITPVTLVAGAALIATRSMRRANRLLPGRSASAPPLRWLWSPSGTALLHRRLRQACHLVGAVAMPPPSARRPFRRQAPAPADGIAQLATDVLEEALALDAQVIAASHVAHGSPRSQAIVALEYQVRGVEDAARRVHWLAERRAMLARLPGAGALELAQRISAMEDALGELSPPPSFR